MNRNTVYWDKARKMWVMIFDIVNDRDGIDAYWVIPVRQLVERDLGEYKPFKVNPDNLVLLTDTDWYEGVRCL